MCRTLTVPSCRPGVVKLLLLLSRQTAEEGMEVGSSNCAFNLGAGVERVTGDQYSYV